MEKRLDKKTLEGNSALAEETFFAKSTMSVEDYLSSVREGIEQFSKNYKGDKN